MLTTRKTATAVCPTVVHKTSAGWLVAILAWVEHLANPTVATR
jgi:hypothetical protein